MKKEEKEPIKKPVEEKEKPTEEEFTIIREEVTLTEKPEEEKVEKVEDEEKTGEENLVEKSAEVKEKTEVLKETEETKVSEEEEPRISSWDLEEETSPLYKKNKSFFKIEVIVLIIILIVTGVLFFFFFNSGSRKAPVEEKKTVEPTKAPEKAQIDKSEWKLEVLNGSGVAGVAAKAAAKLTEQGYTVIKTGNADNQDYKKNELFVSENMQSKAQLLIENLKNDYGFTEVKGVLKDSTASARIILGSE